MTNCSGWKWSVQIGEQHLKAGTAFSRIAGIRLAQSAIDQLDKRASAEAN
jgi:hypothetical protein